MTEMQSAGGLDGWLVAVLGQEQAPGVPGSASEPVITSQGGGSGPPPPPPSLLNNPLFLVFGVVMLMMLMTLFAGRKDKKRRAEMLAGLKRLDRVQTAGGIIGTIVELKDDELVLRVDEATNTRIRFARSAVQQVLRETTAREGGPQVESKPGAEKAAV